MVADLSGGQVHNHDKPLTLCVKTVVTIGVFLRFVLTKVTFAIKKCLRKEILNMPVANVLQSAHQVVTVNLDDLMHLIEQDRERAVAEAEFIAGSSLLITMSPLMVHRLDKDFPSMTGEIIGEVFEEVKALMKPYQDERKAQERSEHHE